LEKPGEKTESSSGYPKTYVVEKGDSYWRIADNFYKNGRLGTLIEKANPGIKLQPGKKLLIPEPPSSEGKEAKVPAVTAALVAPALSDGGVAGAGSGVRRHSRSSADAPSGAPPSSPSSAAKGYKDYVVQKGDTLSLIAKKFYDDPNKFHLIEDANGDLKYQVLQAGAKIKVPIEK
jgi:nucleoid-associated protein YgaU